MRGATGQGHSVRSGRVWEKRSGKDDLPSEPEKWAPDERGRERRRSPFQAAQEPQCDIFFDRFSGENYNNSKRFVLSHSRITFKRQIFAIKVTIRTVKYDKYIYSHNSRVNWCGMTRGDAGGRSPATAPPPLILSLFFFASLLEWRSNKYHVSFVQNFFYYRFPRIEIYYCFGCALFILSIARLYFVDYVQKWKFIFVKNSWTIYLCCCAPWRSYIAISCICAFTWVCFDMP